MEIDKRSKSGYYKIDPKIVAQEMEVEETDVVNKLKSMFKNSDYL